MAGPRRQPLRHVGGPTSRGGDAAEAAVLAEALAAAAREPDDVLTHGFHAYPARMHPSVARGVLRAFAGPRVRVLDPFCGSGTVLLEARRVGAIATGVDLNPVALRVAEVRLDRRELEAIGRFADTAEAVAAASLRRVKERAQSRAPLPAAERSFWAPHVLRELGGLWAEIQAVKEVADRRALEVVLSAIVVKFSLQRADTSTERVASRIGKGVPSRFFGKKCFELAERWTALTADLSPDAPRATLVEGDARELAKLVRGPFDLVLSSPPYGGTYDYVEHHARRYAWLGVSSRAFADAEIGARRRLSRARDATRRWDQEVQGILRAIAEVTTPQARIVLLVGDAQLGTRRIDALAQLRSLAPTAGLSVRAWASQPRPDFQRGPARSEHLVLLHEQ